MTLNADHYVGLVYGLETFLQMIRWDKVKDMYFVPHLPISVNDDASFKHRGLMIDTGRHFLTKKTIKKVIDGMSFTKLNVLH